MPGDARICFLRPSGQAENLAGRPAAERNHLGYHRFSPSQGAGLIKGNHPNGPGIFEVHAALDKDAGLEQSAGQSRNDGHRSGNNQGARARDDQEHEGTVKPGINGWARRSGGKAITRTAAAITAGVWSLANLSTKPCEGAFCAWASSTMWMIRANVVSPAK